MNTRYNSCTTFFAIPFISIAYRPGVKCGERFGHAKGIIAVGDVATGFIASGSVARGFFAAGAVSVGVVSAGAVAIGGLAAGGIALGGISAGGVAIGVIASGGLAIGLKTIACVFPIPFKELINCLFLSTSNVKT
jgi:hypothetical protein